MKRDPDLIREILLETELSSSLVRGFEITIEGYNPEEITYHIMLLHEAGLIIASDVSTMGHIDFIPVRLTWAGHEFLDAARDNERWGKTKKAMGKTGGFVVSVAEQVLIELVKSQAVSYLP